LVLFARICIADTRTSAISDYPRFAKEAEVIAIVQATSSKDNVETEKVGDVVVAIGVDTTFKVVGILKGSFDKRELTVLHFRFAVPARIPEYVFTRTVATFDTHGDTLYLVFLKKRDDGRFDLVNEQDEATAVSVVKPGVR
jgi:hypothetical protein